MKWVFCKYLIGRKSEFEVTTGLNGMKGSGTCELERIWSLEDSKSGFLQRGIFSVNGINWIFLINR
ncbi:hypothetical protein CAEBREN_31985 [Caenorhabditis brenneri]|uniref:Uncharacterized protein n=1 Tax=Caenorhabditis brenneri TaxID=135651 RepID=G0NMN9_CAEBE|nr:hypothetical protein CAEBREN_31985 [Caenorhabditis brenneri]